RRRHTRSKRDWSSDVCSSDLGYGTISTDSFHFLKRFRAAVNIALQLGAGVANIFGTHKNGGNTGANHGGIEGANARHFELIYEVAVGNMGVPSSAAGSTNATSTSAAGKVTPSSSKSPVSCTSPLVMGTSAIMVFSILACQIRTVQWPFSGMRSAGIKPVEMAKAPTAAVRLPQLPLQSIKGLSMET